MSNLSTNLPWDQAKQRWASQLNPVIANPMTSVSILEDVVLTTGVNIINHKLGRPQSGWFLTDIQGVATVYRSAPFTALTLTLTSSANVTCSIGVF